MYKTLLLLTGAATLLQPGHSWKYCSGFDQDSDDFGVQDFDAISWNDDDVHLYLSGKLKTNIYPAFSSASGKSHLKPTMEIKIFKESNGKKIYSDAKVLCDDANCPLLDGDEADIKVSTVSGFDKKLKNGDNYVVKVSIVKRCGKEVTCVEDKFCYLGNENKKNYLKGEAKKKK